MEINIKEISLKGFFIMRVLISITQAIFIKENIKWAKRKALGNLF